MNLSTSRILIAAHFSAPYGGNFIASLKALQSKLHTEYQAICAFVFPKSMKSQPWASQFIEDNTVYLTGDEKQLITDQEADNIIMEFKPDLIHTHFEGYDQPLTRAAYRSKIFPRIVYHLHDPLLFHPNPLKALYQVYCFFNHYGSPYFTKSPKHKPSLIGICEHELKFARRFRLGKQAHQVIIPNGLDISRINPSERQRHNNFTFLAFAGRNVQKRVDLLVEAASRLIHAGYKIKVVIVDGNIPSVADTLFEEKPEWLMVIPPSENINSIYALADCFVSTSVHETFSYSIAEAVIFGLPIIQSDIEGTLWNSKNPSTYMFKSLDIDDLVRAMKTVMEVPNEELREMCEVSAKNIIGEYSLASWTDKVINFFISLP